MQKPNPFRNNKGIDKKTIIAIQPLPVYIIFRQFRAVNHLTQEAGLTLASSQFEAGFLSLAHSDADISNTIAAAEKAFAAVKSSR